MPNKIGQICLTYFLDYRSHNKNGIQTQYTEGMESLVLHCYLVQGDVDHGIFLGWWTQLQKDDIVWPMVLISLHCSNSIIINKENEMSISSSEAISSQYLNRVILCRKSWWSLHIQRRNEWSSIMTPYVACFQEHFFTKDNINYQSCNHTFKNIAKIWSLFREMSCSFKKHAPFFKPPNIP